MKIYIDGENLVHRLVEVLQKAGKITDRGELKAFDLSGLCREVLGVKDIQIFYYTTRLSKAEAKPFGKSVVRRTEEIITWTSGWGAMLAQQGVTTVRAGRLKIRGGAPCPKCSHVGHVIQEKGVDVQIAVDIVLESSEGVQLALLSSDSDLIPAVRASKVRGARVKNLAPEKALNKGLAYTCGEWQLITDKQLIAAYERAQKKGKLNGQA